MPLGFLTATINDIEKAARLGFDAVELNTDAFGKAGAGELDHDGEADRERTEIHDHPVRAATCGWQSLAMRACRGEQRPIQSACPNRPGLGVSRSGAEPRRPASSSKKTFTLPCSIASGPTTSPSVRAKALTNWE